MPCCTRLQRRTKMQCASISLSLYSDANSQPGVGCHQGFQCDRELWFRHVRYGPEKSDCKQDVAGERSQPFLTHPLPTSPFGDPQRAQVTFSGYTLKWFREASPAL